MTEIPFWLYLFALWGFGLLFGSFANVVIWRLPRGESLSMPPSHCPQCDAPIAWYDNIPLLSWVLLRAKCRRCGARIPVRYPIVEATSGALWLLAGLTYGISIRSLFAVAFFYLLLVLAYIDVDHQRLPNAIVATVGGVGLVGVAISAIAGAPAVPLVGMSDSGLFARGYVVAGIGVLLGAGLSLAIAALYGAVRGKAGLGMGDIKLLGAMGVFLGPYVLLALVVGSILGAIYGFVGADRSEGVGATRIPFGPFLAAGGIISAFAGPTMWMAYARLVGIA